MNTFDTHIMIIYQPERDDEQQKSMKLGTLSLYIYGLHKAVANKGIIFISLTSLRRVCGTLPKYDAYLTVTE